MSDKNNNLRKKKKLPEKTQLILFFFFPFDQKYQLTKMASEKDKFLEITRKPYELNLFF